MLADYDSGKQAMARLQRAIDSTDSEVESFVERAGAAFMKSLPEGEALRFERIITLMAQAAEELGYDAEPGEIRNRARELATRLN